MKILLQLLIVSCLACAKQASLENVNNDINDDPKREVGNIDDTNDWQILFDGTHTRHWKAIDGDQFPENAWVIENGALVLKEGGDIITREKYGEFDLRFEFNFTQGANSGLKYYVSELTNEENGSTVFNGPEYQIIDDEHNPDIQNRSDEKSTSAAVYLLYAPVNKALLPAGKWNTARIVSKDGQVEHWLNGVKVVTYERGSKDFLMRKANTKFKNIKDYGEVASGHIMLTDHHDKVYFRNIKIKEF